MSRINLSPLRVRQRALAKLETRIAATRPCWVDVVGRIPPAQVLVRNQPQQHPLTKIRTKSIPPPTLPSYLPAHSEPATRLEVTVENPSVHKKKGKKASRMFQPIEIRYEEDALRKQFFSDHPWELARPRVLVETDRQDAEQVDWSKGLKQPNRGVSAEDVIQRQLYLLQTSPDITVSQAYDQARKEFYELRRREEIERRIAAEEAEAVGAQFGPNIFQWGMQIENKWYNDWEAYARRMIVDNLQREAAFAGQSMNSEEEAPELVTESVGGGTGDGVFASERTRQANSMRRSTI